MHTLFYCVIIFMYKYNYSIRLSQFYTVQMRFDFLGPEKERQITIHNKVLHNKMQLIII